MTGRKFSAGTGYRYGFNGKENDNEIKGEGAQQDYGMRIYDPRLGKFLSVDPLTPRYPMLTPYQFASNTPISGIDLDGLEFYYAADGSLIGKIGNDTKVKLVNDNNIRAVTSAIKIANTMVYTTEYQRMAANEANKLSKDVGLSNDELNVRAFLGTITRLEGAAYNKRIGGSTFEGNQHPGGQRLRFGKDYRYVSPAGAYQFTEETAIEFQRKAGVDDFSPLSQDAMAVTLIKEKKALNFIKSGDLKSAFNRLNKRWSSMPGGSEPNKNLNADQVFKEQISTELQNSSPLATPKGKLKVD